MGAGAQAKPRLKPDTDGLHAELVGCAEGMHDAAGEELRLLDMPHPGLEHHELVPADPGRQGGRGEEQAQPDAEFLQQGVPGRVAVAVVDGLEAVEIEAVDRHAGVPRRRHALEGPAQAEPVGEPRQGVAAGERRHVEAQPDPPDGRAMGRQDALQRSDEEEAEHRRQDAVGQVTEGCRDDRRQGGQNQRAGRDQGPDRQVGDDAGAVAEQEPGREHLQFHAGLREDRAGERADRRGDPDGGQDLAPLPAASLRPGERPPRQPAQEQENERELARRGQETDCDRRERQGLAERLGDEQAHHRQREAHDGRRQGDAREVRNQRDVDVVRFSACEHSPCVHPVS